MLRSDEVTSGPTKRVAAQLLFSCRSPNRRSVTWIHRQRTGIPHAVGQQLCDNAAELTEIDTQPFEDGRADSFALPHDSKKDVLGSDVVVAELEHFAK